MKHKVNPLRHIVEFKTSDTLHINVETERLVVRSILSEDEKACITLLGDPIVMQKFATGVPYDEKTVKDCFKIWKKRWEDHDPYSVYAISLKKSKEFVGIIALGRSAPGESEVSYAIHHKFWGERLGSETVAVLQSLIPKLMLRGYTLEYKSLKKLVATARLDNPASKRMLTGIGFKEEEKIIKYGADRYSFGLFAKVLSNEYQNFFTRRDLELQKAKDARVKNKGVEVTEEEMATSSFGQQSYTAGKARKF